MPETAQKVIGRANGIRSLAGEMKVRVATVKPAMNEDFIRHYYTRRKGQLLSATARNNRLKM